MKKKRLAVFLAAAFLFLTMKGFAQNKIVKNELTSAGKKRSYYLYVPQSVSRDKPAALLVLLHGSGRNGRILLEHWQKLSEKEGIILAGPDARDSAGWYIPQDGPQFIYDLVEDLKLKQPVDSRRVYLFGHSAGGGFALFISLMESKYFAAASTSAASLNASYYDYFAHAERKIPVALFVGTNDPLVSVEEVRRTRAAFAERKFEVELTEIPGLDHNYYSRSNEINEKAWNFLKKFKLEDEQHYKQYQFKSE